MALAQIDALLAMQGTDVDIFSMVNASLSSVKTNLDAVQSALAEQSKTGYLTYETYQNLVKANGEYANAIEYTGSALRLNAKEAAQIDQEQMEALKRQAQTSAMEAMRKYAQDKAMLDSEKE